MCFQPVPRCALRTADFGIAHLFGNLTAQLRSVPVAVHGRDVEPLVRLYQINRYARSRGIDHAKAEAIFGVRWFGAPRRHFHARHFGSPFFPTGAPQATHRHAMSLVAQNFVQAA